MAYIYKIGLFGGGFFNNMWDMLAHYIYCKKNNLIFYIDDSKWLFKYKYGWRDYFTSLITIDEAQNIPHEIHPIISHDDNKIQNFTLEDYHNAFHEVYKLNNTITERINITLEKFSLIPNNYNSIMIRRGDKIIRESLYIDTIEYLKNIIADNKDIFVQTDDYNAYKETCDIINNIHPNIKVYTTCPSNKFGSFVFTYNPEIGSRNSIKNNNYLKEINTYLPQKSVINYTSNEMKEHVEEMLTGLEICKNAKYLCTDLQSNVTRFFIIDKLYNHNIIVVGGLSIPKFNIPLRWQPNETLF